MKLLVAVTANGGSILDIKGERHERDSLLENVGYYLGEGGTITEIFEWDKQDETPGLYLIEIDGALYGEPECVQSITRLESIAALWGRVCETCKWARESIYSAGYEYIGRCDRHPNRLDELQIGMGLTRERPCRFWEQK